MRHQASTRSIAAFVLGALLAASGWTQEPTSPAVHNNRLIYSAEEKLGQELDQILERSAPHLAPYREIISHWSAYSSISPKVGLTLMELYGGLVRNPPVDFRRPLGELVPEAGFSAQLRSGLGRLAAFFYDYRRPGTADDPLAGYPDYRAAEAASEALLRLLGSAAELERFQATYSELFPNEAPLWEAPFGAIFQKAMVPPESLLQLPYGVGLTWTFNGTHSYAGDEVGPKSSIDMARNWPPWGANTSNDWIVAANRGTAIVHSSCYLEVLGSGGWSTTYYHVDNINVSTGQSINRNHRLANYANNIDQALCGGGHSTGPHVHFSLRRNGQASSLDGVSLSSHVVHAGRVDYDSNCDFFFLERDGVRHCAWVPFTNPGVTVPPSVPPAAPSGLAAVGLSSSEIELQWIDNASDETSFEIQRRLGGSFQTVASASVNSTRHVDSGLASGASYTYRVRARNNAGASAWSGTATAATSGEIAPSELAATARSASEIELTWRDNSSGESRFEIEAKSSGDFNLVLAVPANTAAAVFSDLEAQTTYTFRARAIGGGGNSTYSNEATATTLQADPEPCVEGPATMCLNGGRFKVEVAWRDFADDTGQATVVPVSSVDSGLLWFFDADNWEMLIKVLDGCGLNDRFWVFSAATTNVEYTLRVTDSYTGFARTYLNPLGTAAAAITDTDAFASCQAVPPPGFEPTIADVDPLSASTNTASLCDDQPDRLCLNDARFEVEVEWEDFVGSTGTGKVVPFGSADSGLFWFFSDANWELLIKVLDGCRLNDHFWVFSAATTNVRYTLKVRDTASGVVKEYTNPLGVAANAITDTSAFATCP